MMINPYPFCITLIFNLLDIVSGFIKGVSTNTLSSSIMRQGLWHKFANIFLVVLSMICAVATNFWDVLPDTFGYVYEGVSIYICLMEVISIIENICVINPNLNSNKLLQIFGSDDNGES